MASNRATRSATLDCEKLANAARAAFTAASTSAALPMLMRPATPSVAGLITSSVFGVTGSTQAPLM